MYFSFFDSSLSADVISVRSQATPTILLPVFNAEIMVAMANELFSHKITCLSAV